MADKAETSAEKAYAAASAEVAPAKSTPAAKAPVAKAPATKVKAAKPTPKKPAAKAKPTASKKPAPARKAVAAKVPAPAKKTPVSKPKAKQPVATAKPTTTASTITELKEKIMATAKTPDFSKAFQEAATKVQDQFKTAYDKGNELTAEMTEFTKGNVEAIVEAGKLLAGGVQEMGKEAVEESKSAYETMTADLKAMAGVKTPTELFQLQGELARRNFDAMMSMSSKSSEKMVKLANEAFAPLSSRMSLAAEKLTKAA